MRCPETIELLAFAAGTLSAPAADAVAEHLETCAACGERVAEESLDAAPSALTAVGRRDGPEVPPVSGAEWGRVWKKIEAQLPTKGAQRAEAKPWGGPKLARKGDPDATPLPLFGESRGVTPLGDPDADAEDYTEHEIIQANFAFQMVRAITRIAAVALVGICAYAYVHTSAHAAETAQTAAPTWFEHAAYAPSPNGK